MCVVFFLPAVCALVVAGGVVAVGHRLVRSRGPSVVWSLVAVGIALVGAAAYGGHLATSLILARSFD